MEEYMIEMRLTWAEIGAASLLCQLKGLTQVRRRYEGSYEDKAVEGKAIEYYERKSAIAEYASCLHYNKCPTLFRTDLPEGLPDMRPDVNVRWAEKRWHRLRVDKKDKPDMKYLLVTGVEPTFYIMGWLYGHEAKQEKYWETPPKVKKAAYFVPVSDLRPPNTLFEGEDG